jgi:HAD superfamily hydrolase (TIGR01509 family)
MKLVIFDLDDTLVDFASTRKVAHCRLAEVLQQEGMDSAAFLAACTQVDRPLFTLFEQGQLTRAEYRRRRFSDPFGLLGLAPRDDLVTQLNKVFMDCVNDSPLLYDDVWPVLGRLHDAGVRTAILTNGPSDGQRRKLKATGLDAAVDHIVIGEEIGFSKPHPAAFRSVVDRFPFDDSQALMVGDSPALDYDGALAAGLNALLLDREGVQEQAQRRIIRSLLDLPADGRASGGRSR